MKKLFFIFIVLLLIHSCNLPGPKPSSFNEIVGTKVAIARTATANQESLSATTQSAKPFLSTLTIQHTELMSAVPSLTTTPFRTYEKFGPPSWKDELNSGASWSLSTPNTEIPNVTIKVENGVLSMSRSVPHGGKNWWLNYQTLQDFYLEGKFILHQCSSDDQYGLVFRAPDYTSGYGYYFAITCDGYFNLMRWDENGSVNLLKWEKTTAIREGPNQTNSLGIWAKQHLIRLYANGVLIKEISDYSQLDEGHFGLFIDSRQTPDFNIELDEIAFWTNPIGQ